MIVPQGSWRVVEIAAGGELVPTLDGTELTLAIEGDAVSGSAGVNRYMGHVGDGGFGPLATTMMAGPPELMDQERLFLGHLASTEAFEASPYGMELVAGGVVVVTMSTPNEGGNHPGAKNVK